MEIPYAPPPAAQDRLTSIPGASGIWSLDGDRPVNLEEFAVGMPEGQAVVLVRSEDVLLLPVSLPPLPSALRRREALPFAIEEHIAEPLDQVHVALGAELTPGIWLAAVVSHELMAQWIERLAQAGLEHARLVPDTLCLPVPDPGRWSVNLVGDRAMVRVADGSGFAVPSVLLEAAWHAAGKPECVAFGEPLSTQFAAVAGFDNEPLAARLLSPALDLRQGRYAAPRKLINPVWKRIALVAGIGAMAHGAIAIADTIAIAHLAQQRTAQVRAMGAGLQPPVAIGDNLGDAITALTPDPAAGGSSRFMTLLSRSAAALAPAKPANAPAATGAAPGAAWRSVSFDGAAGTLTIEVETDNIADLQRMAQALTGAGLSAQPGSATTQGGKAIGSFVVRAL